MSSATEKQSNPVLKVNNQVVKRSKKRHLGLFIDGTALDRAGRRLRRKIELSKLVKSLSQGVKPIVARYYTMVPFEDDSRHRSYLDAVHRAGLEVVVKRLPPKGVGRQVDVLSQMASDIVAFGLGHHSFSDLATYTPNDEAVEGESENKQENTSISPSNEDVQKIVTIVCPSRDLGYTISLVKEFGIDTINADFGQFAGSDVLKNASKWIDLSDAEDIWRD